MKVKLLSLCLLTASLAVGGVTLANKFFEKNSSTHSVMDETITDDVGEAINLAQVRYNDLNTEIVLHSDLGVQLLDGTSGSKSLRFVGALNNYIGLKEAKFSRVMKDENGAPYKQNTEYKLSKVYTSVKDDDTIRYATELESGLNYFFVYTMSDIPEDFWFYTLDVVLTLTDVNNNQYTATMSANVKGVEGDKTLNVRYIKNDAIPGTYGAHVKFPGGQSSGRDTSITEAVINDYYMTVDGFVATKIGKVIKLSKVGSTGSFENCSSLVSVTLPDSILELEAYSFYNCPALKTLCLPRNVTTIANSIVNGSTQLDELYYNCKNLVSTSAIITKKLSTLYVSSDVESLPSKFANLDMIEKIEYEGTTAQWNLLLASTTSDSGLDIYNTICSDTEIFTVNFHLNGGSMVVDSVSYDDVYTVSAISAKAIANPGKPSHSSLLFDNWYADQDFVNVYDFSQPVNSNLDLYAKYIEYPEGLLITKPLSVTVDTTLTATTNEEFPWIYYSLTAPEKDIYYFETSNVVINLDLPHTSTSTTSPMIKVYNASTLEEISYSIYSPTSTAKVQGTSDRVLIAMEKDEKYIVAVAPYHSSSSKYYAYGSVDLTISTQVGDSKDEAMPYTFGTTQEVVYTNSSNKRWYKFNLETGGNYLLRGISEDSLWYQFTLYDNDLNEIKNVRGTTNNGDVISLEGGKDYYVYCSTNGISTDTKKVFFSIGEVPQGASVDNALELTIGNSITVTNIGVQYNYYSVSITANETYVISLTSESTGTKSVILLNSSNEQVLSIDSANSVEKLIYLEAGEYILKTGYKYSTATTTDYSVLIDVAPAGITFSNAIEYDMSTNTNVILAADTGKYYKFVAAEGRVYQFVPSSESSVTMKLYSYSFTSQKESLLASGSAELHAKLVEGTTYYLYIETSTSDVSITYSIHDVIRDGKTIDSAYLLPSLGARTLENYGGEKLYYEFTVETAGTYKFWSNTGNVGSYDMIGYLYKAGTSSPIGYNDDDYNKHPETADGYRFDFYFECALEVGVTYYFYYGGGSSFSTPITCVVGVSLVEA